MTISKNMAIGLIVLSCVLNLILGVLIFGTLINLVACGAMNVPTCLGIVISAIAVTYFVSKKYLPKEY